MVESRRKLRRLSIPQRDTTIVAEIKYLFFVGDTSELGPLLS